MLNYQPRKKPRLFKAVAALTLVVVTVIVSLFQNRRLLNHWEASLNVDDIDIQQMTKWEVAKDDGDTRPWMIIHIGPEKTATTTIQAGLAKYAKMLAKDDDFYFLGHKGECVQALSLSNSRVELQITGYLYSWFSDVLLTVTAFDAIGTWNSSY